MKTVKQISIHSGTRIKVLLDEDKQGVIDELIKLNRNFSKLRNPILRNLFASRVTIADACKIANCKVEDFLSRMSDIGFLTTVTPVALSSWVGHKGIDFSLTTTVLELDARTYLENNQDPLKEILAMVNKMAPGERLKITNTFEPTPLISLLIEKGFTYDVEFVNDQVVITWFEKHLSGSTVPEIPITQADNDQQLFNMALERFKPTQIRYIDVRGLQMPEPMLLIIENIDTLPADGLLYVYHKKVPVFLLPELNKRGMSFLLHHKSAEELDMLIYKS